MLNPKRIHYHNQVGFLRNLYCSYNYFLAIESTDAISAQDSFSSFSIESVSLTESEQTVVEPPIKECEAQKEAMPSCSSRPTKSDKRKSKKALVAKMGRVVDLLKLRKN